MRRPPCWLPLALPTALALAAACEGRREAPPARGGQPYAGGEVPPGADRYARLVREFLTAPDPPAVHQRLTCELWRMAQVLETNEAISRAAWAKAAVVRTRADSAAYERADAASGMRAYQVSGPLCDSLNAVADREDGPIAAAPPGQGSRP